MGQKPKDVETQLQKIEVPEVVRSALAAPEIDEVEWQPTGPEEDRKGRLLAAVRIIGVMMHLEAWAVQNKEGFQVSDVWDDDFQQIAAGIGIEEHWHTIEIEGREYVLIATPYC